MGKGGEQMQENKTLTILKDAILLERRGRVLYELVSDYSKDSSVKDFFIHMAQEEKYHEQILAEQYKNYIKNNVFSREKKLAQPTPTQNILSIETMKKISAASYEASAISAAISMEQSAVKFYSDSAESAEGMEEKELYQWLSNWEQTHLDYLISLDEQLKEQIWYDNKFWPM